MSAATTSRTHIAKLPRCSQPGHGHARPDSYPSALSTVPAPESHRHRCSSEPESHQRPPSPERNALAPCAHHQHRDQIAIARAAPSPTHLPRVPSLEAFGRRPGASRSVAMRPSSETLRNRVTLTVRRSLPVYPDQRTSSNRPGMSGWCQQRTYRRPASLSSSRSCLAEMRSAEPKPSVKRPKTGLRQAMASASRP